MPLWKPHALAKPHADQLDLRMGDRVRTIVDLPTVADGTEGKVILANGFNWQRYRVLFPDASRSPTSTSATSSRSAGPPSDSPSRPPAPLPADCSRPITLGELSERTSASTAHQCTRGDDGVDSPTPGSSAAW